MLKCKSCKYSVSYDTIVCPKCGDPDCVYNLVLNQKYKEQDTFENLLKAAGAFTALFLIGGIAASFSDISALDPIKKLGIDKAIITGVIGGVITAIIYNFYSKKKSEIKILRIKKEKTEYL
ncbi:MAG: hypothetical protein IPO46_09970 [Chitinophagaceae bacterium]|jgi:uncharacterized YccA/Bax inhibitor family protein|nr:hypothetical protein [Chitinophagaceae bacterium]MBK8930252.1 hypothetical protein [Chitinophagaceae bacterium]MBL0255028.1 hypothetical protein [Chitinophagaceae bacterium]MBP8116025.1 hypothetical protein [Chitinophagaceae bacterium]QQS62432.1 MAG: hypothetical protein IPO46_09970 [Chitinophagaceae bacterium]